MHLRKYLLAAVVVLVCTTFALGKWAWIQLDELIRTSDLIVVGTLHDAQEDSRGIGHGYVAVEQVVTSGALTLEGKPLVPGNNLKLTWADDWACAAGMHRGRIGKKGVWLLQVKDEGTVTAAYLGRFLDSDELEKVIALLRTNRVRSTRPEVAVNEYDRVIEQSIATQVDVTPFNDYSLARALEVFLLATVLYWILYKRRFSIR